MEKKIEGPMQGIVLHATITDEDGNEDSDCIYLYPPEHTPTELVKHLRRMVRFIQQNKGATFWSDRAE